MATENNVELVRRAYAAFSAGDVDRLREVFGADVVHVVPGTSTLAGAHKGIDAVLMLYGKLAEMSGGSLRVELEDVMSDGGDRVMTTHRALAQRNGKTLDSREGLVITIQNGKVVEIQDFFSDIAENDSFWE